MRKEHQMLFECIEASSENLLLALSNYKLAPDPSEAACLVTLCDIYATRVRKLAILGQFEDGVGEVQIAGLKGMLKRLSEDCDQRKAKLKVLMDKLPD